MYENKLLWLCQINNLNSYVDVIKYLSAHNKYIYKKNKNIIVYLI